MISWRTMTRLCGAMMLALVATLTVFGTRAALGQDADEGFPLPIVAAFCEQRPTLGPFQGGGCVPGEGASFDVETTGGEFLGSCTATSADVEGPPAASCTLEVPFGSTVVVTLDESTIPADYALSSPNPQTVEIPSGPPQGQFGGAVFIALLQAADDGAANGGDEATGTSTLPTTGTGHSVRQDTGRAWSLLATAAVAIALMGLVRRRTA